MREIHTILCPVDFSDASEHALEYAIDLARKLNANIHIMHAWQPVLYAMGDGVIIPTSEFISALMTDLKDKTNALVEQYQGRGVSVSGELLEGIPYEEIVRAAQKLPAELIVMGTHGRSGLVHFMLGSIAERVVRTSPVPVLTVRYSG
jgi:nucleotide-binding universal stress UspA family protein